MNCKKCGNILKNKQTSYCSPRCAKLHLKSLYRKRNREKINAYNRRYRQMGIRGNPCTNKIISDFLKRNSICAKCGTNKDLCVCHIKPRVKGGKNLDNLITLCKKHHYKFDKLLEDFWT